MNCKDRIVYTVQEGDTLYRLSRTYHTTVTDLILGNPGTNPYNLQAGMKLNICPGEGYAPAQDAGVDRVAQRPAQDAGAERTAQEPPVLENAVWSLWEAMRLAWLDMAYWKRMYMMSVDAQAMDQQPVEERLIETADEITDVFSGYLPAAAVRELRDLLVEHVELTGELMRMLKSGNMENYDALIKEWYANASRIAMLLGRQNPYFGGRETNNMLQRDLDLTRESMEHQFNGEYAQSIETFGDQKRQVLELADHFAQGLFGSIS